MGQTIPLYSLIIMKRKYKICPVCGNKFHVCWTCEKSKATSWKKVCDSFEHYSAYVTGVLWRRGEISDEEARERF